MNTQETDYKDRCEDVFPNNGLYVYIDIVHILWFVSRLLHMYSE